MHTDKLLSVKRSTEPPPIYDISHRDVFFVTFTVLQYYCIFVAHHTYAHTKKETDCSSFLIHDAFNIYLGIFMK